MVRNPPHYVVESGIIGTPVDFKWGPPLAHIGPVEGTSLHDAVYKLSHCAAVALGACLEEWAAWRFSSIFDTQSFLLHADGIRAWAIDPRYFKGRADWKHL